MYLRTVSVLPVSSVLKLLFFHGVFEQEPHGTNAGWCLQRDVRLL